MPPIANALTWFGEVFFASLVGKACDYAIQKLWVKQRGQDHISKLETSLLNVKPFISRIENMWIEDENREQRAKQMLMQLKDTIRDAHDLLEESRYQVLEQGDEPSNLLSSSSPPRKKIRTSPLFGRKVLNELRGWLLESANGFGSSSNSICVLTIVGIGGVGMTTLGQQAYNHEHLGDYFQLKAWVSVSDEFNLKKPVEEIIESATRECSSTGSLR